MRVKSRESMLHTLISLRGNPRACLYLEPLWGIPYNLYLPFAAVFMTALGMDTVQIGLVSTVAMLSQMVWAPLSGVLTDKLGRRKTTVIFDIVSWSIPALLWMCAQGFVWFLVAAVFNGAWRVTETSWGLLLVEDADERKLVNMFSISHIAGLIAGFVAPVAYYFVQRYGVVSTMRVLYLITFVMMTTKFVTLYFLTKETAMGERRMAQTKDVPLLRSLAGSGKVLRQMLHTPAIVYTVGLIACFTGIKSVSESFWPILVTQQLGIAAENLSVFSTVKSLLMLACYFVIVPRLSMTRFRWTLLTGFGLLLAESVMMLWMPPGALWAVALSVVLEALALSMLNPLASSLQMLVIDKEERARMLGLLYVLCLLLTAPLGTLAGLLAKLDRALPFALNAVLVLGGMALSCLIWRETQRHRLILSGE